MLKRPKERGGNGSCKGVTKTPTLYKRHKPLSSGNSANNSGFHRPPPPHAFDTRAEKVCWLTASEVTEQNSTHHRFFFFKCVPEMKMDMQVFEPGSRCYCQNSYFLSFDPLDKAEMEGGEGGGGEVEGVKWRVVEGVVEGC